MNIKVVASRLHLLIAVVVLLVFSFHMVPTQSAYAGGNKKPIIAIDAGHQARGNSALEAIGPGAAQRKAKVSSGTAGVATHIPEYQLTLAVAKRLQKQLVADGYQVYMIRETHNVNISNRERAQAAAAAKADILVRIHANGSENRADNGILLITPTAKSPYIANLYPKSRRLANNILTETLKITGANSKGVWETNTMSGVNWATMPVVIVEMGFMSNPREDKLMQTSQYQEKLAKGIATGINRYFNN